MRKFQMPSRVSDARRRSAGRRSTKAAAESHVNVSQSSRGIVRETGQRRAIRRAVERANGPLSVQDVLDAAQAEVPGLGIATVYRNLKTMVEDGFLTPIEIPGEPARYEPADKHHHHHFRCRACDRVFDISGCSSRIDATVPPNFRVEEHVLVLYGRCPDCSARTARGRRTA